MRSPGHLRIDELRLEPGREWNDESCAWRFVRVRQGEAYWLDPAKPRLIAPGELLVLAPNVKGVIRASQLNEVVLDGFQFDPILLCGLFTVSERHLFETGGDSFIKPIQFLPSTHPVSQSMAALIGRLPGGHKVAERAELLVLALRVLAEAFPAVAPEAQKGSGAQDRFQEIITRMPDLELIDHTSEQLARLCGCTPRHFNRLFRAQFGESPRARQTELRLLKARHLLGSSEEKVTQIAAECGYGSLSLFNSLFRRRFGMSPSEWRQRTKPNGA